jgi:hypothetical protein
MENIFKQALEIEFLPRSNSKQTRKNFMMKTKNNYPCNECKNKIDCICNKINILIRPAEYEETCFIFDMAENLFHVNSSTILSLKKSVTEVVYPFTDNYDFYRLNYNHQFNIYPLAIVRAHTIEDIENTIIFCRKTGIPLRARGGAHCYQPASLVNFGIILDQRPRDKIIEINKTKQTVEIQAGALLGPIVNELSKLNFLMPTGTCVTNGLAGLTLGGGIGFSLREYGLTLDKLINMKIVLANGNTVEASKTINSDLFWALRGAGGGNFGVVTDFTFEIMPTNWVTIFTIYFKFEDTKKVFNTWQRWAPFTNTKLTSEMDIFNKFQSVIITGQLLPGKSRKSDEKLLFKLIKPLLNLGLHISLSIKTITLEESYQYFGQGSYARPLFFYNQSDFNFELLPEKAIDIIIHYMSLLDITQSHHKTEMNALGGNFSKVPSDATAFPSRSAIYWLQYASLWDVSTEAEKNIEWLNSYYRALRPFFPKKRKYVNALDYNIPRLPALKSYYGENLLELIKIKHKYDPTNFFQFEQSIPSFDDFE